MSRKKMQKELFEAEREQRYLEATTKAKKSGLSKPGRGLLPFVMQAEQEVTSVTGRAGLPLVVETFRGHRGDDLVRELIKVKKRQRGFNEVEMVEDFLLLLASGGEHVEDFEPLGQDDGLWLLLGRDPPSPDAALTFLKHFHDERLVEKARKAAEDAGERSFVPEENAPLRALGELNAELVRRFADPRLGTAATLDHDATIIESHKQEATVHYKGGRGYQPSAVLWTEQDLGIGDEFRDGNVPAAKDNLRLIRRAFRDLPDWVTARFFRADSACYEEDVLKWLAHPKRRGGPQGTIGFTISADLSKELQTCCKAVLDQKSQESPVAPFWQLLDDSRANETAEWSEVEFNPGNWPKTAVPLRYLVIRFRKRQGGLFPNGESVKHLAVVTNREGNGDQIIRWHWQKAGSIEHFHDELKNGLGAGTLPCAEFGANAAWYRLNVITYNVLSALKKRLLPPAAQDIKAKRLRFIAFDLAARITSHARYLCSHVKAALLESLAFLETRLELRLLPRKIPRARRRALAAPA